MEKTEIELNDNQIKTVCRDLINKKANIIALKSKIENIEYRLESGFNEKAYRSEIAQIEKAIKDKKDTNGLVIEEYLLNDLSSQLKIKERELLDGILDAQDKAIRAHLGDLRDTLDREEGNIKVLEKQIRTKKAVVTR